MGHRGFLRFAAQHPVQMRGPRHRVALYIQLPAPDVGQLLRLSQQRLAAAQAFFRVQISTKVFRGWTLQSRAANSFLRGIPAPPRNLAARTRFRCWYPARTPGGTGWGIGLFL